MSLRIRARRETERATFLAEHNIEPEMLLAHVRAMPGYEPPSRAEPAVTTSPTRQTFCLTVSRTTSIAPRPSKFVTRLPPGWRGSPLSRRARCRPLMSGAYPPTSPPHLSQSNS